MIELMEMNGETVAFYEYDPWGKLLSVKDASGNAITSATHIANINPIRYRGYYYDTESGFYYLRSRYYDPEVCRWLSPEPNASFGGFDEGAGILAYNTYVYCANNPVMLMDQSGESITLACIIVGAILGAALGGYTGHKQASKAGYTINDGWKYLKCVLGYGTVGAGDGALIGWGVGAAAAAIGAYMTAGSCGTLSPAIYSNWQQAEEAIRNTYKAIKNIFTIPGMNFKRCVVKSK